MIFELIMIVVGKFFRVSPFFRDFFKMSLFVLSHDFMKNREGIFLEITFLK